MVADSCGRLRTVADGCGRKRNVERTHPSQPPDPQSETGTVATHSGKNVSISMQLGSCCCATCSPQVGCLLANAICQSVSSIQKRAKAPTNLASASTTDKRACLDCYPKRTSKMDSYEKRWTTSIKCAQSPQRCKDMHDVFLQDRS